MTRTLDAKGSALHKMLGKVGLTAKQVVNFSGKDEIVGYEIEILKETKTLSGNLLPVGHRLLTSPELLYLDVKKKKRHEVGM